VEDDRLDSDIPTLMVSADITTLRVFGILNILFSMLAGCFAIYALAIAIYLPMMAKAMEEAGQAAQESTAAEIEVLEEEEAAATTEEEKAEIRAEIGVLESEQTIDAFNPFEAMTDPKVLYYGMVDGSTGLFLNLLMFISGIGLLFCKEWARKLALWTAGLKIFRLVLLQAVNMIAIIPIQMKGTQEMYQQMGVVGQGPDMTEMAGMQGAMYTAWAVVMLLVGCSYPALSLWFLSRPGVKAACQLSDESTPAE
jgi:hypothetical protein